MKNRQVKESADKLVKRLLSELNDGPKSAADVSTETDKNDQVATGSQTTANLDYVDYPGLDAEDIRSAKQGAMSILKRLGYTVTKVMKGKEGDSLFSFVISGGNAESMDKLMQKKDKFDIGQFNLVIGDATIPLAWYEGSIVVAFKGVYD